MIGNTSEYLKMNNINTDEYKNIIFDKQNTWLFWSTLDENYIASQTSINDYNEKFENFIYII